MIGLLDLFSSAGERARTYIVSNNQLKINIDDLRAVPQQRLNLSFKESFEGLDAVKPVLGEFTVSANVTGIRLNGVVQTLLKLTCHRCLRPYFLSLNIPVDEWFPEWTPQSKDVKREHELLAEDFVECLGQDGTLDIGDVVYQAVTLATPVSCLCGDNCPGPAFPSNEAKSGSLASDKEGLERSAMIDPRWKNLKSLFPKDESE